MNVTTQVVRGNTIRFDAAFTDYLGNPVEPASATLALNYASGATRATQQYPMAWDSATDTMFYEWDSSVAVPCEVQWSVFSAENSPPVYVGDGCFELDANSANFDAIPP